jgi:hypothetical protein
LKKLDTPECRMDTTNAGWVIYDELRIGVHWVNDGIYIYIYIYIYVNDGVR